MLVESLTIENLRGIRKCDLSGLGQINLLIGKNNQGKSTILDSLLLTSAIMFYSSNQVFAIIKRHSERSYNPRELLYKYNQHPLSVSVKLDTGAVFSINTQEDTNNVENFSFYLSSSFIKGEQISAMTFSQENFRNLRDRDSRQGLSLLNRPNQRKKGVLRQLPAKAGSSERRDIQVPEEILSFIEKVSIVDPAITSRPEQLEGQFDEIKQAEKYDITFQALKETYDDNCRSWELSRYLGVQSENRTAFTYTGGRPVYVDDIGDGMKTGFAAVTLGGNRSKTILLVEEIETHQHPAALRKLVKFLVDTVINNELQLFITTHSPDVLRYFTQFYPPTKVFLIEKDPTNDTVIASSQNSAIDIFSNIGWDFGDLFKFERIVLVDGTEDSIILEDLYLKIKGRSLGSDGIDLLALRGTNNFPATVYAFAVSNKQAILVRDLDNQDKNGLINQTKEWLRVLRGEGYTVEEDATQIRVGKNGYENRWVLPYSKILTAGDPQRFPQYQTHSMTDYILEFVLDFSNLFNGETVVPLADYRTTATNSKNELTNIFGQYNDRATKRILDKITKETIPRALKENIIDLL